jgi:outer membrane protein OmpA-like peptidoglycan-associated protein
MRIEISGHTDNKGSAQYNQTLSESRSKSVVDYLISKGIAKERLEYKGYGLTQPMASNDNEEGRQLNRRTEFKILSK